MNATDFIRNLNAHSREELAPYLEKHLAWSEDGKQVLAVADTLADLLREIDRLGLKGYVVDFLADPDISSLGGAGL